MHFKKHSPVKCCFFYETINVLIFFFFLNAEARMHFRTDFFFLSRGSVLYFDLFHGLSVYWILIGWQVCSKTVLMHS